MVENEVFDIPDDDPFKNDKLGREPIADNLEKIIAATTGSLVLSIDAGWGNGKTTFIDMWRKKLDIAGNYKTLHFNAWENDDCEDPLLALINEIEEVLGKDKGNLGVLEKIKTYGKPLLKNAFPGLLKLATSGWIDIKGFQLTELTGSQIIDLVGKMGEFENYKVQKEAKDEFRKALIEYQKSVNKKIIFFIDELDRCRPTFAIETLEKIKHLFNIDNFIFILALDRSQLSHSIKTLYGQDMDSTGYLRRFIDLEFILPEPNRSSYIDILMIKYNLLKGNNSYFLTYLKAAVNSYDLSLRDIEKLFYYLRLILPITPLMNPRQSYERVYLEIISVIYSVFPVIKIKDNNLYQMFIKKEHIDSSSVVKVKSDSFVGSHYSSIMLTIIDINNNLKPKNNNFFKNEHCIGNNDYDLIYLLDKQQEEFNFIKQLEFADNFTINS